MTTVESSLSLLGSPTFKDDLRILEGARVLAG